MVFVQLWCVQYCIGLEKTLFKMCFTSSLFFNQQRMLKVGPLYNRNHSTEAPTVPPTGVELHPNRNYVFQVNLMSWIVNVILSKKTVKCPKYSNFQQWQIPTNTQRKIYIKVSLFAGALHHKAACCCQREPSMLCQDFFSHQISWSWNWLLIWL